jgi:signal transduction histidine kinase
VAPALAVGAEVELLTPLLTRAVGPAVAVRVAVATAAEVAFDAAQLGQVLLNLAINARDAMADGGRLAVTVRDAERPPAAAVAAGAWVAIEVRDTGAGMDAATASRAFEAYFTTKPAGRGTGLGLAMVRDIVRQHGGTIDLASAPGAGTAVTMYLPVVVGDPAAAPPVAALDAPTPRLAPALALGR